MERIETVVDDLQQPTPDQETQPAEGLESLHVAQLFRDDQPGLPQRMLVVIEGYGTETEPLPFTGDVSLMVLMRSKQQPLRLKRWDFSADDVAGAWQSSHLGDGLHLELPLEETKLPEVPLELWVRYVDAEGRKLLVRRPFQTSQLAGLEVETGAKQLAAEPSAPAAQLAESSAPTNSVPEPELAEQDPPQPAKQLPTEKIVAKNSQQSTSSGWRRSTVRTGGTNQGFATTIKKTSGWTAQTKSGSLQQTGHSPASNSNHAGPVWTAGRVKPSAPSSPGSTAPSRGRYR